MDDRSAYYEWESNLDLGGRAVFARNADGSLSVAIRTGDGDDGVIIDAGSAASLRQWMNDANVGEAAEEPPQADPQPVRSEFYRRLHSVTSHEPQVVSDAIKGYGEFVNAGSTHMCPYCDHPTTYRVFSGGKEWYCDNCDADGSYPAGAAPTRVGLLATDEGRAALREHMRTELTRRAQEGIDDAVQAGE